MALAHTLSPDRALIHELPTPSFVPIRYRPGNLGTWSGHLTFANDLIAAVKPSLIVELGTHWGESYFTFCQSVFQNGLDSVCYAVDHWLGEPHAGFYGEEVFQDVENFNQTHYRGFSYLLRMSFDDAALQFADDSIDLLHIDGLHTYEAASHDFRSWFPKLKPGGIILFHDVAVRHADFGVWRLWDELTAEFHETFTFHHWWGLGVLQKPGGDIQSPFLDLLFKGSDPSQAERLRRHYVMCTWYLESTQGAGARPPAPNPPPAIQAGSPALSAPEGHAHIQVFPFGAAGYSEATSLLEKVALNQWQDLSFTLPLGTGSGPLRIDPSDCISVIEIRAVTLTDETADKPLFDAQAPEDFQNVSISDSALSFDGSAPCSILSLSADPFINLPESARSDGRLRLDMSIRIQTAPSALAAAFKASHFDIQQVSTKKAEEQAAALQQALQAADDRVSQAQAQIERLDTALASAHIQGRQDAQRETRIQQELLDASEDHARELTQKLAVVPQLEQQVRDALKLLEAERKLRASMLQSKSWTLTKPLRDLALLLKG